MDQVEQAIPIQGPAYIPQSYIKGHTSQRQRCQAVIAIEYEMFAPGQRIGRSREFDDAIFLAKGFYVIVNVRLPFIVQDMRRFRNIG